MQTLPFALLATLTLAGAEPAPPTSAAPAVTYRARVRLGDGAQAKYAVVGELTRDARGAISVKGIDAPELEALSAKLEAEWRAHKVPEKVKVTESVASDTGMRPSYSDYTFEFTKEDVLYPHAVLREFLRKHGYADLGLTTLVKFVEVERGAEWPPDGHDRAAQTVAVRKGKGGEQAQDGKRRADSIIVYAVVRGTKSPGPGRASASDPTLVLATNYDEGHQEIGRFLIREDGSIALERSHSAELFARSFSRVGAEDVDVAIISPSGSWSSLRVPKTSPRILEATILLRQSYDFYDVVPVIDPAQLR